MDVQGVRQWGWEPGAVEKKAASPRGPERQLGYEPAHRCPLCAGERAGSGAGGGPAALTAL